MSTVLDNRQLITPVAVIGGACFAAVVFLFAATSESTKVVGGVVGASICLLGAFLSGNPRLYSLWALMFFLPLDLSKRFGPVIEKMGGESAFRVEASDPFLLLIAFYLIRDIYNDNQWRLQIPKVTFVWMLIMFLGLVTVVVGPFRITAAQEVFRMVKVMILFVVLTNELKRPQRILHCTAALALGVIVQSIIGLVQYATRRQFGLDFLGETGAGTLEGLAMHSVRTEKAFRAGALLQHPNIFGIFLAALLPLAIGVFLLRTGKGYRLYFLISSVLGMAALITTLSRSGWVSFAASSSVLLCLMIFHKGLRRRSLLAAVVAMSALGCVSLIFAGPILTRIYESKASAMLGRLEYINTAMGMIRERPILGWGLNSYVWVAPPFTRYGAQDAQVRYGNWLPPVHNIYLLWMAETGVVGLLMHLAVLGFITWAGIRNLRVRHEFLFTVNAACLAGIVALMVDGMLSFTLRINSMLRVFWVLSAIIMAIHYWRLRDMRTSDRAPMSSSPAGAAIE